MDPSDPMRRLEQQLRQAEEALLSRYFDLGRSILEPEEESPAINRLLDEVIDLRCRLSSARGEIACPACLARNPACSRICCLCGASLPVAPFSKHPGQKKG